jgi:hypothetical protein
MTKDEALQMCLEYIETDAHERKYVRHAIKKALAAPVQPVATLFGSLPVYDTPPVQEPVAFLHNETGLLRQANRAKGGDFEPRHWMPLYTTPPEAQRQWVGLTTEDILNLGAGIVNFEYAKAIEAKLKEKNNG